MTEQHTETEQTTAQNSNEVLVHQFAEMADGNFRKLEELFPPDFSMVFPPNYLQHELGMAQGIGGVQTFLDMLKAAFPDIEGRVDDVVSQGNKMVVRMTWEGTHQGDFLGIAPTGRRVSYGRIEIERLEDGKLAEHWGEYDFYGLLRQLGAVPAFPA